MAGIGGDPDTVLVPPTGVDADEARLAVYERVLHLLEAAARGGAPLAVVVDDLQWADPTSLRCLSYLAGALRDVPIALAVTLRDGEGQSEALQRMLGALVRVEGNRQLVVPPLATAEVRELAGRVSGQAFSGSQAAELAARTGGDPLFVSEYARLPEEERLGDGIPIAVRSVLGRRLAGLDPAVLQVLRAAAVIGDVLEVDTLAGATRLDLDTLADYLDEAADEHILVAAPGTAGYAFARPAARGGAGLDAGPAPATDAGPVLNRLAGIEPLVAGDPAAHARVLATLAVGSCYDPGPDVPDGLSTPAIAIAEELGDPDVIADAILGRVDTYIGVAGQAREAVELMGRLSRLPHRQSQVDDVLGHAMLSMTEMNLGDTAAAAEHVRRAIAGSDLLRLPVIRVQMRWMQGELAESRGDFDAAAVEFATAAEIHRQTELQAAGTTDLALHSTLWHKGRLDELPEETVVEPMVWGAVRAAARGETDAAAGLIITWLATPAPTVWTTLGHEVLATHLVADLRLPEPAEQLIGRLAPFTDRIANIGQVGQVGSVASATARLHLLLGRPAQARELLAKAHDLARRTGGRPTLLSCRLNFALLEPDPAAGRAELVAVAAEAARIGMKQIETAALAALS